VSSCRMMSVDMTYCLSKRLSSTSCKSMLRSEAEDEQMSDVVSEESDIVRPIAYRARSVFYCSPWILGVRISVPTPSAEPAQRDEQTRNKQKKREQRYRDKN
jgi:hypothetical protein